MDLPDFLLKLLGIFSNNSSYPIKIPVKVNSSGLDPALRCYSSGERPIVLPYPGDHCDPIYVQASRLCRFKLGDHCGRSRCGAFCRGIAIDDDIAAGQLAVALRFLARPRSNKHQNPHIPNTMGPFDALDTRGAYLQRFRAARISVLCDGL
jgi:hypothetical protein